MDTQGDGGWADDGTHTQDMANAWPSDEEEERDGQHIHTEDMGNAWPSDDECEDAGGQHTHTEDMGNPWGDSDTESEADDVEEEEEEDLRQAKAWFDARYTLVSNQPRPSLLFVSRAFCPLPNAFTRAQLLEHQLLEHQLLEHRPCFPCLRSLCCACAIHTLFSTQGALSADSAEGVPNASTASPTPAKRRKVFNAHAARARALGMEPARTDATNYAIPAEVFVPCGHAGIDASKTGKCPYGRKCRAKLYSCFSCFEEYALFVAEARYERIERAQTQALTHCWAGVEGGFSHTIHVKSVLDADCMVHGVRVCETAAAYFHGHTDHCLKEARKWRAACAEGVGEAWVAQKATRATTSKNRARGRAKTDDAMGWLSVNVPMLSCSPPNKEAWIVLNLTVGQRLWKRPPD